MANQILEKATEEKRKDLIENHGFVPVNCRLCGTEWLFPPHLASQFDVNHPLECAYCKAEMRRMGK